MTFAASQAGTMQLNRPVQAVVRLRMKPEGLLRQGPISERSGTADVGTFGEIALPGELPRQCSANDAIGSVVLAGSSSERVPLFARYRSPIGPRLALSSSCERIRHAVPFLTIASSRLSHGSSRIRKFRNSTGEPSDSRHKKPLAGEQPVPPETSSPFTQRRTSPLMART